jgi:hypothetical protein
MGRAIEGVTYSPRFGGICPECGAVKAPTPTTRPWEGVCKIRYHKCKCGCRFKSIETDYTEIERGCA